MNEPNITEDIGENRNPKKGAQPGNANARFWSRREVETARLLIDVWATQVHHSMRVIVPVYDVVIRQIPVLDERTGKQLGERLSFEHVPLATGKSYEIEGDERAVAIDQRTSGDIALQHRSISPFRDRGLTPAMEIKLMVAEQIEKHPNKWAPSLMLHLYPRSGPYHEQGRILDQFRPDELVQKLRKGYEGPNPDRFINSQLNLLHKSVVGMVIPIGPVVLGRAA